MLVRFDLEDPATAATGEACAHAIGSWRGGGWSR